MPKLLIVDDDLHLRKLVLTYAEAEHHECAEAKDGQEALDKARAVAYDLILLDVMMPGMDGFEVLAQTLRGC